MIRIVKMAFVWLRIRLKRIIWNIWYDKAVRYEKKYRYDLYSNEINFLMKHKQEIKYKELIFPYDFALNKAIEKKAEFDEKSNHYYIAIDEKRLFFPSSSVSWIERKYHGLELEQNEHSPHRYFTNAFFPSEKDVFIDVGCAEGKEALEIADVVKKLYLIEADSTWAETIRCTFAPYRNKTEVVCKFASNVNTDKTITIDALMREDFDAESLFIKMDVEGHEMEVLDGMKEVLLTRKCKICVATYHKPYDVDRISEFFKTLGYQCEFSEGIVLLLNDSFDKGNKKPPYFRKGVLRAHNY